MPFPSPPWDLSTQAWLSLFRLPSDAGTAHPAGLYVVAFVSYEEPSPLIYRELLVAQVLDATARRVRISDIWVDSETSREGGRVLWALPKELATLDLDLTRVGPTEHAELAARPAGREVASAQFAATPGVALVRTPFAGSTSQLRDGRELVTPMRGSARALPALATWDFAADGQLGFLHGRRPLVSFRLRDGRLLFG